MSSKRRSAEGDVVRFFMTAEPVVAATLYRFIGLMLDERMQHTPDAALDAAMVTSDSTREQLAAFRRSRSEAS